MLSKEEYRAVKDEVIEWTRRKDDSVRHQRGGTTIAEMIDLPPRKLREAEERALTERDRRRGQYWDRQALKARLGDEGPDGFKPGLLLGYFSPSRELDPTNGGYDQYDPDRTPEMVAKLAASEIGKRKLKNRIATIREASRLCGALADALEQRLQTEQSGIRRIR
jgi:hypothetical protein